MARSNLPEPADATYQADRSTRAHRSRGPAQSLPTEGVLLRRSVAFLIDFTIIGLIFALLVMINFLTFGLLTPLLALSPAIPIAYHTLLIGSERSATLGMQFLAVEVRSEDGGRPGMLQAFAMTALFYLSTSLTSGLILLVALFNDRRRCLHDMLSGTSVVRRS